MNNKNIVLAYFLAFLQNSWFWLGVWVFYYLRFTNYAGIGLLETVMIGTLTFLEIPSGAVADLLGKKNTLILAFFLQAMGNLLLGYAPSFAFLAFSIVIACMGGAFQSGAYEALIYDSLKEERQADRYNQVIANVNTIRLIAQALTGAVGGFIYVLSPGLPFYLTALANFIGFILCFWLREPKIDTIKFSVAKFIEQTKQGFRQLLKSRMIKEQTMILLTLGIFSVISVEMVGDLLAVEFGFNERQLGVFWAGSLLLSSFVSQISPTIGNYLKANSLLFWVGIVSSITYLLTPLVGLVLGALTLIIRVSLGAIFNNISSVILNNNTESKYRATTLSTFNMMKNFPYMLGAFFIGTLMDVLTARIFTFGMGVVLLFLILIQAKKLR